MDLPYRQALSTPEKSQPAGQDLQNPSRAPVRVGVVSVARQRSTNTMHVRCAPSQLNQRPRPDRIAFIRHLKQTIADHPDAAATVSAHK